MTVLSMASGDDLWNDWLAGFQELLLLLDCCEHFGKAVEAKLG